MKGRVDVAVGVLWNDNKQVLVGQRTVKDDYFAKWEFPGGKLELDESSEQALKRELMEELGVDAFEFSPLITIDHDYPDRYVRLHVHTVLKFDGLPHGKEGQALKWVQPFELLTLDFLAGNQAIVESLVATAASATPE